MTNLSTNLKRAGDVLIQDISIVSSNGKFEINVRPYMTEIRIFEDLFSACLSGTIFLADSFNLIQQIPITGHEILRLSFCTPSTKPVKLEFLIYGISDRIKLAGDTGTAYGLNFVAKEQMQSNVLKVSKSFSKVGIDSMVESIFRDNIQDKTPIVIEPTYGKYSFVFPFWKPIFAINWLCNYARSKIQPDDMTYLFYQTLDSYHFRSLSWFFRQKESEIYTYSPEPFLRENGILNPEKALNNIIDYFVSNSQDKLCASCDGTYAAISHGIDPLSKTVRTTTYEYSNEFNSTPHLNQAPLLPRNSPYAFGQLNYRHVFPKHSFMYDDIQDNDQLDLLYLKRHAFFKQLTFENLVINIPGDSRRRVGEVVYVRIPSRQNVSGLSTSDLFDPRLSGRYIITSLCHLITDMRYTTKMTLSKDSVAVPYPEEKEELKPL